MSGVDSGFLRNDMINALSPRFSRQKSRSDPFLDLVRSNGSDASKNLSLTSWSNRFLLGEDCERNAGFWKDGFGMNLFRKKIRD